MHTTDITTALREVEHWITRKRNGSRWGVLTHAESERLALILSGVLINAGYQSHHIDQVARDMILGMEQE